MTAATWLAGASAGCTDWFDSSLNPLDAGHPPDATSIDAAGDTGAAVDATAEAAEPDASAEEAGDGDAGVEDSGVDAGIDAQDATDDTSDAGDEGG